MPWWITALVLAAQHDHWLNLVLGKPAPIRLFLNLPVASNASAAALAEIARFGFLSRRSEHDVVAPVLERVRVFAALLPRPGAIALSGGNQQKALFVRAMLAQPRVLVCDEPTRGVDVPAREETYALIELLARSEGRDRDRLVRPEGAARPRAPCSDRPRSASRARAASGCAGARHRRGVGSERR